MCNLCLCISIKALWKLSSNYLFCELIATTWLINSAYYYAVCCNCRLDIRFLIMQKFKIKFRLWINEESILNLIVFAINIQ